MSAQTLPASTNGRFSAVAIILHWAIAALIVVNLYLGLRAAFFEDSRLAVFEILQLHKSIGVTVLVLSIVRLVWRLVNPPPPYPDSMKPWEKAAASAVHWGLYGLMIGLPLVGWVLVSASRFNLPTLLYKTIPWPHLPLLPELAPATKKIVEDGAAQTHAILAWIMIVLLVLHVGAALKHQFLTKDGVLYRIAPLPFFRSRA